MSEPLKLVIPVAVKRLQRAYVDGDESVVNQEVALMKTAGDHLNILSCVHTEIDANFL